MKYKLRDVFSVDPDECIESILRNRGVEDVESFLSPDLSCELDYNGLDNINDGVEMLLKHLNGKIGVIVDSDVDGITSSVTMMLYIKKINPIADIKYFCHEGKKHGMQDIVEELEEEEPYDLIIVPDAGSNDIEQMNILKEMGTDVLILDHHECEYEGYDCLPSNTVLINVDHSKGYKNRQMCGAGVVYKFCEALDDKLDVNYAHDFIDIVALGEIADGMGKTSSETNYIMTSGVKNIKNGCIAEILASQEFKLKEKALPPYYGLTTTDLAFYVSPLLNAIVRVGTKEENETVVEAFLNPDKIVPSTKRGSFGETERVATQVARLGANCRSRQNRIKDKAIEYIDFKIQDEGLLDNNIIIINLNHDEIDIPNSLTGLIAQNFVGKYGRPVLLGREGPDEKMLKGSIRGSENFESLPDLKAYLMGSGYFESVMGHANAAGFAIPMKNIDTFTKFANDNLKLEDFENCYIVDYILDADDENLYKLAFNLASRPDIYGSGIDEVHFVIKGVKIEDRVIMGADKTSCKIPYNGIDYVKFKDLDFIDATSEYEKIDVLCKFSLNSFNGKTYLQAMIEDYEPASHSKYDF